MTRQTKRLVIGYGALRAVYAVGLLADPDRVARPWLGDVRPAAASIATRGLGARELALCAGAITAVVSGTPARPWLLACVASDATDVAATLSAAGHELPARSKPGTVLAAGAFGVAAATLARRIRGEGA